MIESGQQLRPQLDDGHAEQVVALVVVAGGGQHWDRPWKPGVSQAAGWQTGRVLVVAWWAGRLPVAAWRMGRRLVVVAWLAEGTRQMVWGEAAAG